MKKIYLLLFLFTMGCSGSHFTFSVRNAITGEPLENVCVERHRGVGLFVRVFNPIRATYFPTEFDSSNRTDNAGCIIYKKGNPKRDRFILHLPPNLPWDTPLYVKINEIETKIFIKSFINNKDLINTGYSISLEKNELFFSAILKPSEN